MGHRSKQRWPQLHISVFQLGHYSIEEEKAKRPLGCVSSITGTNQQLSITSSTAGFRCRLRHRWLRPKNHPTAVSSDSALKLAKVVARQQKWSSRRGSPLFTSPVSKGAGHWLVAYRKAEEQKYRTVRRRVKETSRNCGNDRETDAARAHTLDGPLLLRLHCVDEPSGLCSVDISEQNLNSVKPEDLRMFDNVAYINASINSLSLESFSSFASLRELNLSLNGLCNMAFTAADFPHLQVLDLSYNRLSADDIVSIGQLPRLKVLHLTGNRLHHLPPNLGSFNQDTTQPSAEEEDTDFKALEVLVLDDNKLSSGVFNSLANLKRLKFLNLQGNRISEIPYLHLMGGSNSLRQTFTEEAEKERLAATEPNPNTGEHAKRNSQLNWEENRKGSSSLLPELQFLNLADNKIAEEEALMAAALFPMLREIDIRSNPLTTQRSGDPPLLTHYLQERLGITIKRKKTQEVTKPPLKASTDPTWKVEEKISKVSKKSLLMDAPSPTVRRTTESEGKSNKDSKLQENTEHFFLTQAAEFDHHAVEKETAEEEDDTVPVNFTGYEILTGAKPNPDVKKLIRIQTAVRMLDHTLRNLNVYRDPKPKLDCIQTPYREREKKIKDLPPLKAIKQPAEKVDELIREMKATTTITEVPLSSAMAGTGVTRQEALLLLRDMKTKYNMVYRKQTEQAASLESVRNTNQNRAETPPAQMI